MITLESGTGLTKVCIEPYLKMDPIAKMLGEKTNTHYLLLYSCNFLKHFELNIGIEFPFIEVAKDGR